MDSSKKCTKCGLERHIDNFFKDSHLRDGYRSHCKECDKRQQLDTFCVCGAPKKKSSKFCWECRNPCVLPVTMSELDVAWVAGLLEGEGTWGGNNKSVWVSCTMTDLDVLEKLQRTVGVGKIYQGKKQKPHYKDFWIWQLRKKQQVATLSKALLPHMGKRRRERIEHIVNLAEKSRERAKERNYN